MIPSKNYFWFGFAFWLLSACPLHAKDIVIATSSMTLTSVPYLVAIDKKFFEKEGLAAQYVVMRSDIAVKGLLTEDVDYNQSVSSVLRAGVAGAPMVTVAGIYNRTFFELIARRDIKSLAELKGKTVGISRYGASTEYALRFGLKANGIDPDKQIKMLAVGEDAARIAGLQNGTLAAIVSQVPANFFAHKVGGHTLLPLGDYLETLLAGVGVSQKKLEQSRDEVKRVIRALLRSLDFMYAQPVEVKGLIRKRLRVSETDIVDHIYTLVTKYATRNGIPSQRAIEDTLLGTPFEGKVTNFEKLTDFSIARELAEAK
ncbi:MAG TPA: ABC transporter substrate-binding protein [Candidatus Eisenbacteria bacterium]|jgi:ABC-type nitrate/sulfonate/bicarbonate transport system substrate-binding protein|nr:ABC transporter substrate-binding protein [Candidatus Eisenbacteria bacterium]